MYADFRQSYVLRHALSRRDFLVAAAVGAVGGRRVAAAPALHLNAVGQTLIQRDLASQFQRGFDEMRELLRGADASFTNLETAIRGPLAANAATVGAGVHAAPAVLNSLRQLGFNLLSLSNNHASDLGEMGILSTLEETKKRGFVVAGTGRNLAEAARPGVLQIPSGRLALIAMASSAVPPSSIATTTHGGVHHVAQRGGIVDAADRARVLSAISTARSEADWVVVYQHDHYWARDWQETPEWKKTWCRDSIDAGAAAFISHGVPILHGIEIYKGRPIFYGLGNFVFHIAVELGGRVPDPYNGPFVYQSIVARCTFDGDRLTSLELDPITLKSNVGVGEGNYRLHGNPHRAKSAEAGEILSRVAALSRPHGTIIDINGAVARVRLAN